MKERMTIGSFFQHFVVPLVGEMTFDEYSSTGWLNHDLDDLKSIN